MTTDFDDRVVAAVRSVGPDAVASAVWRHMSGSDPRSGPSIGRLITRLGRLAATGRLRERWIVDDAGRERRAYTVTSGMRRGSAAWGLGRLVPA